MKLVNRFKIKILSKVWTVFFLFFFFSCFAQKHNILVVNDLEIPIKNISVIINEENYHTNTKGEINFEGFIRNIKIESQDYFYSDENIEKDGFYKIRLSKIKTTDIQEVTINKKDSIINPYKPKRELLSFTCSSKNTNNTSVLVNFEINKKIRIKNYSFFIMSDEKLNKPFNFVIYKKVGETMQKFFSQKITTYLKNDNTIDLSSYNLFLEQGNYFFGMEWIINDEMIINTTRLVSKKYPDIKYIGQELGGSLKKNINKNQTYFYKNNILDSSRNKSFQQLKISL